MNNVVLADVVSDVYAKEFSANSEKLYHFLQSKQEYSNWIKNRVEQYGFMENADYMVETLQTKGRPKKIYWITLNMAKELCMVENNDKGREARKYFIEMEKKALHVTPQNFTMKAIAEMANSFLSVEQDIAEVKADVSSLKNTSALTATDCFNYQKAVKFKVDSIIAKYPTVSKGVLFSQIHGKVKEVYKVASYKDLPHFKINELLDMVNALDVRVA